MKIALLLILTTIIGIQVNYAQPKVYDWSFKNDGAKLGGVMAVWGGSIYFITRTDRVTEAELATLDPLTVNSFDRGAIFKESYTAELISDVGLVSSLLIGFSPYLGKTCRSEKFSVAGMAIETFFVSNALTNICKVAFKRFRPYTYVDDVPIETKLSVGAGYSFPSGHTSASASLCFFSARVFSELYPESKWKKVVWTSAALIPMVTGYSRYRSGKHFPTDVIAGYVLGAVTGIVIPGFHKFENDDMSFDIRPGVGGLTMNFSF